MIVKNPSIFLLDEAVSALDAESEKPSSLQRLPSVGPSVGRQSSISYLRELSRTETSIGGSFRSDKDSIGRVGGDDVNKSNHVSAKRLDIL
ncbi:ABC transporter B member, variant 2 [Trifolium repens]|nr:ABC transporter B member, variant 2 [Trifolium repens]WJX61413.1 ABC transporter B member, variant 2 [Trifolium repens]